MKRNGSMLFDLELDENESDELQEAPQLHDSIVKLRAIMNTTKFEKAVAHCVRQACQTYKSLEIDDFDYTKFVACYLTLHGYDITLRKSHGGGNGSECLQNLRHSFIICTEQNGNSIIPNYVIIEPSFRDHFAVARPSPKYKTLFPQIPSIFVGSMQAMQQAVLLLCSEVTQSFVHHHLPIPIWRQYRSLITKWLPKKWEDEELGLEQEGAMGLKMKSLQAHAEQDQQKDGLWPAGVYNENDGLNKALTI